MTETPFQLGVSRSIPSHLPSPTLDTSQSSPSSDTYLRPSDTGVSWGSSESSDILFQFFFKVSFQVFDPETILFLFLPISCTSGLQLSDTSCLDAYLENFNDQALVIYLNRFYKLVVYRELYFIIFHKNHYKLLTPDGTLTNKCLHIIVS